MKIKLFIAVVFFAIGAATATETGLDVVDIPEHQKSSEAVVEIIRSLESGKPSVTLITKSASQVDRFTEIISRRLNGDIPIQIYSKIRTWNGVLLIVLNETSISEVENILLPLNITSQEKVLVVFEESDLATPVAVIKLILEIMWRKFVVNVQVIIHRNDDDVHLYTFFPFTNGFCGQVNPVLWNIFRSKSFEKQRDHFPSKTKDFVKCELSVAVFNAPPYMVLSNQSGTIEVEGVDGNILKTLATKFNFRMRFSVVSEDLRWGEIKDSKLVNDTQTSLLVSGALGLVSEFVLKKS